MHTLPIVYLIMENIQVQYQDIANRNGSENLFDWYHGVAGRSWETKNGTLLSWSVTSAYDAEKKHFIIPVGIVMEPMTKKIKLIPANRITIVNSSL